MSSVLATSGKLHGRWRVSISHVLGGLVGGVVTGLLLSVPTFLVPTAKAVSVETAGILMVVVGLLQIIPNPPRPPSRGRQVPNHWRRRYPASLAALMYGLVLGVGFATRVRSWLIVGMISAATLVGGSVAVGGMALFGLVRSLVSVVISLMDSENHSVEDIRRVTSPFNSQILASSGGIALLIGMGVLAHTMVL